MATVGDTTIEPSWTELSSDSLVAWGPFTAVSAGSLTLIEAYLDGAGSAPAGTQPIILGIYNDSAGAPGSLVGACSPITITHGDAAAWKTAAIAGSIVSGNKYWVALISGSTTGGSGPVIRIAQNSSVGGGGVWHSGSSEASGMPATWPGSNGTTGEKAGSLYATYTSSGSSAFVPQILAFG